MDLFHFYFHFKMISYFEKKIRVQFASQNSEKALCTNQSDFNLSNGASKYRGWLVYREMEPKTRQLLNLIRNKFVLKYPNLGYYIKWLVFNCFHVGCLASACYRACDNMTIFHCRPKSSRWFFIQWVVCGFFCRVSRPLFLLHLFLLWRGRPFQWRLRVSEMIGWIL